MDNVWELVTFGLLPGVEIEALICPLKLGLNQRLCILRIKNDTCRGIEQA